MGVRILYGCIGLLLLASCVKNDVPYPYIPGNIIDMAIEGQIGEAEIDGSGYKVNITVGGEVDIDSLKIIKLKISEEAMMLPDSAACVKFVKFPRWSFDSLEALPSSANTFMRMGKPVKILLQTYQEYLWTITVKQVINRVIKVENQVGEPIIDESNKTVLIYVSENQPLNDIRIDSLELGGSNAIVLPDPQSVSDFSRPQKFIVYRLGKYFEGWIVDVVQTALIGTPGEADVWARRATVMGGMKQGVEPGIEYKKSGEDTWTVLPADAITKTGSASFKAELTGLEDGTTYVWRIVAEGQTSGEATFTTEKIQVVPNLNFDTWAQSGKNWYPNPVANNYDDPQAFWATGNEGVTSGLAGGFEANTVPTDDAVSGKAVRMVTLGKVNLVGTAAGNLSVGTYKTNMSKPAASVSFGQPFTGARPTGMKGWYKYKSMPIDYVGIPADLKDDLCHIYVKIWDAGDNLIGYGEFVDDKTVNEYTEFSFDIAYSNKKARPAKMTIVATSSRYGGDFSGSKVSGSVGVGSELYVDEFELLYE